MSNPVSDSEARGCLLIVGIIVLCIAIGTFDRTAGLFIFGVICLWIGMFGR